MSHHHPQPSWTTPRRLLLAALGCACGLPAALRAQAPSNTEEAALLALENLSISTVSNRPQRLSDAAAAIQILNYEDLVQSGASSLPEALRQVPGLKVAQINAHTWAIGSRSYQWQNATKLLVMIDGRSVYSPVFGGVSWDVQDILLEDLDRIEIVNGPGGSIWGANAFNGVINVLSKPADRTLGTYASLGGGTRDQAFAALRQGWRIDHALCARLYAKLSSSGDTLLPDSSPFSDSMRLLQSGFRLDHAGNSQWTLQGDVYAGRHDSDMALPSVYPNFDYTLPFNRQARLSGANLKALWLHHSERDLETRLQAWYDFSQRDDYAYDGRVHTLDLSYTGSYAPVEGNRLDWGLGGRLVADSLQNSYLQFPEHAKNHHLLNAYLQDEHWFLDGRLALTTGLKIEHNENTGWEPQPNLRLLHHLSLRHTLWTAWSHAVRTPSRFETSGVLDARVFPPGPATPGLPLVLRVLGASDLHSEAMDSFEAGWRWQYSSRLQFALTSFCYNYRHLQFITTGSPYLQNLPTPALIQPASYDSGLAGESYGSELSLQWQASEHLRIHASYSFSRTQLHTGRPDPFEYERDELTTPRNSALLGLSQRLGRNWEVDTSLRYQDTVPYYGIPAYVSADLRLAWQPTPSLELALQGRNLLEPAHAEYKPSLVGRATEIPRVLQLRLSWRH